MNGKLWRNVAAGVLIAVISFAITATPGFLWNISKKLDRMEIAQQLAFQTTANYRAMTDNRVTVLEARYRIRR